MPKYSKSFVRVNDPYSLLALNVFLEAFRDIENYFNGQGSLEERIEGKKSIKWMMKMDGNFKILAGSTERLSIEEVHQLCIKKINDLKRAAYVKKELGRKN